MKYLLPILFAFCFFSCQRHSDNWEKICDIENYIESRPDSALTVLEAIDVETLSSNEERAKYALYMSMALDKNYIDKTDFDVLQPAIDYYEDHGSATDKLRMHYYQGRIFQNKGDDESAMECFVNGLTSGQTSDDILTKARILYTQGRLYSSLFEWDACVSSYLHASEYFKQLGKTDSYLNCIISIINVYTIIHDPQLAEHYILLIQEYLSNCNMQIKGYYYSTYLTYTSQYHEDFVLPTIKEYINTIDDRIIDWLSVANAYLKIGDTKKAQTALMKIEIITTPEQHAKYLILMAEINKKNRDFEVAMDIYESYVAYTDSLEFAKAQSDTRFIEERHELELRNIKEKEKSRHILFMSIIMVAIVFIVLIMIRYSLKIKTVESKLANQEKEKYRLLYLQMEQERDKLNELLEHNNELNEDAQKALSDRVSLLNRFFMVQITDNHSEDKKFNQEIERLIANKAVFITSTRLAFAGSHPKFIKHLESCGLNEWEINYCCLYALGLKGHEIGDYIQSKSHFNQSLDIRKKLGLQELNIHLRTYILNLLNEE